MERLKTDLLSTLKMAIDNLENLQNERLEFRPILSPIKEAMVKLS